MVLSRKLSDLYVTGQELTIDDGKGEPVTVYIRKISPLDAEEAYRAANAAKVRAVAAKTDPEDLTFQIISDRVERAAKEDMVAQLADHELQRKRLLLEAELEAEDKWSNDEYLQGLHDAWESGMKKKHFTDPDAETKRIHDELEAFNAELEKRMEREMVSIKKDLETLSARKLKDQFFDAQFDRQGEIAWITEYRKQELYFAVRDPEDHSAKAFESPQEIDGLEPQLIEQLREAYVSLSVDAMEGKD